VSELCPTVPVDSQINDAIYHPQDDTDERGEPVVDEELEPVAPAARG